MVDTELLEIFSKNRKESIKELIVFHAEEDMGTYLGDEGQKREDEEKQVWEIIKERITELNSGTDLKAKKELVKILLKKTKLSQRKIAEMLEIDRGVVQRQRQRMQGE